MKSTCSKIYFYIKNLNLPLFITVVTDKAEKQHIHTKKNILYK